MAYFVYTDDVQEATKFSVPNHSFEENVARAAARRVGWAIAAAYRKSQNIDPLSGPLPQWLQKALEESAPD